MTSTLRARHCVPCDGSTPKLGADAIAVLAREIPAWSIDGERLRRRFGFKDFVEAMSFVNRMADVAEAEGHHPDFTVHYRQVDVVVWTHAVGGLSENDFVLAVKIDALVEGSADSVREG